MDHHKKSKAGRYAMTVVLIGLFFFFGMVAGAGVSQRANANNVTANTPTSSTAPTGACMPYQRGNYPDCAQIQCPDGQTGTYPICQGSTAKIQSMSCSELVKNFPQCNVTYSGGTVQTLNCSVIGNYTNCQ